MLVSYGAVVTLSVCSGAMTAVWAGSASAAATTWLRRTWTGRAAKTTAPTSAATTANVCAVPVSARRGIAPRRGTAASTASVTTSTVTAPETNSAEVSVLVHLCLFSQSG